MSNFRQDAVTASAGISDPRLDELSAWLEQELAIPCDRIVPTSGDASFRRYFRVFLSERSLIAMDAPPSREDVRPFVQVARLLEQAGVNVPRVHAVDEHRGFVLLGDLGTLCYRDELDADSADRLYRDAIDALVTLQQAVDVRSCGRPFYGEELLRRELGLFKEWFLDRLSGIPLTAAGDALLEQTASVLVRSALEQPQVFVHRDYHSRNLMVCLEGNPGILDFQDAVVGPITYDLVSLLRDCYISWPEERVARWVAGYLETAQRQGLALSCSPSQFRRWFDLMGMQRHLKAVGIFSRLALRDGKSGYLDDIPRTLAYVTAVSGRYPELADFAEFLDREIIARSRDRVAA